jgi:hypothetical protein
LSGICTGRVNLQPVHFSLTGVSLSTGSYFTVAITAINRSALTGFEGYGSFLAAIGAYRRVHLTPGCVAVAAISVAITAVAVARRLPCLTAFGAAFGLVGIASRLEQLLFLSAEGKSITAIGTFEGLVLKTHWMASSLNDLVRVSVIQYLM